MFRQKQQKFLWYLIVKVDTIKIQDCYCNPVLNNHINGSDYKEGREKKAMKNPIDKYKTAYDFMKSLEKDRVLMVGELKVARTAILYVAAMDEMVNIKQYKELNDYINE